MTQKPDQKTIAKLLNQAVVFALGDLHKYRHDHETMLLAIHVEKLKSRPRQFLLKKLQEWSQLSK